MLAKASPSGADCDDLPAGWRFSSIGEHYKFKNGLNKAKRFFGHGTPIINYMDVYRHPWLLARYVKGTVSVTKDEMQSYSALQGDAFFTRTSETVGEIGLCSVLMDSIDHAVFSGFVLRGRPLSEELLPGFAAYALRGRQVRKQIEARATYTTRALTNGRALSEVRFALPSEPHQKLIASALRDADDLIACLDALLAKKHNLKRAAMQQLIAGRIRLNGHSKSWEWKDVASFGTVVTGRTPDTTVRRYWGGPYPWITPTDIGGGRDISASERQVSACGLATLRVLPPHTLLVTCIASIGKNAILRSEGACNQQINAIIPNAKSNVDFLYYLFEHYKDHLKANAATTATAMISKADFSELRFFVPDKDEQEAISAILSQMDDELSSIKAQRTKVASLREAMAEQLLDGRIRFA